jgi:predicted HNH restriction endonuclease
VDVHHINKNPKQNNIRNLIGLCPNHHMLVHRRGLTIEEMKSKRIGCNQLGPSKKF